jgi:hypothetical protein
MNKQLLKLQQAVVLQQAPLTICRLQQIRGRPLLSNWTPHQSPPQHLSSSCSHTPHRSSGRRRRCGCRHTSPGR